VNGGYWPLAVGGRSAAFARARPATHVIYSASVSGGFERQLLDHHSKRIEKREELLLLCLSQIEEAFRHVIGLALVALDRILQR